jgi:peptidoglycan/xylan/chitin deacetylase (PgdA/CDA1 family)
MGARRETRSVVQRWFAAQWWRASDRPRRDRDALYAGATGLRALTFHETVAGELEQVRRIVDWCRSRFPMATPEEADALFVGRWRDGPVDRVLVTFDDGLASNYEAARFLADAGVQAIFFVVPSLVDRTMAEYLRYHERFGVAAHPPLAAADTRGLSRSEVREIAAMGHRVGAHNFAHRDLGRLHHPDEIQYEVANALEGVAELTGAECRDFAIGFGQPENVSDEAAAFLVARGLRTYACHRGLNVPGRTPRFLLRHSVEPDHPFAFTRICVEGGADRRLAPRAREMVRRVGALPPTSGSPPRA